MYHQFKELADVDITKEPMEVGPTCHYIMGGVRVDADTHGDDACPACSPRARSPAACTAPTASAATRCPTCWCSAGAPGSTPPSTRRASSGTLTVDAGAGRGGRARACSRPSTRNGRREPYAIHARPAGDACRTWSASSAPRPSCKKALEEIDELKQRARQRQRRAAAAQYNPGWHLALDLALAADVSPRRRPWRRSSARRAAAGTRATTSRRPTPNFGKVNVVIRQKHGDDQRQPQEPLPEMPAELKAAPRGEEVMAATEFTMRVWRGDAKGGELQGLPGRRRRRHGGARRDPPIQATQASDLAVRWNCKAGKCGSCSAEVNGKPRLMCMTRMNTFQPGETITVPPIKTFPIIRDLVTDVSFNYEKAKTDPGLQAEAARSRRHVADEQEDIDRVPGVPQVHRVLPLPGRLPRDPRPRGEQAGLRGPALLRPAGGARDAPARHRRPAGADQAQGAGSASATSPSAAPRSAPSTSTSPTTPSSRSRSAWSTEYYDPVVWLLPQAAGARSQPGLALDPRVA